MTKGTKTKGAKLKKTQNVSKRELSQTRKYMELGPSVVALHRRVMTPRSSQSVLC
jgi:hypothetical protein